MNELASFNEDGTLDVTATRASILAEFPALAAVPLDNMLRSAEECVAELRPGTKKKPQFLWLFFLAGRIKGFLSVDDQRDEQFCYLLSPIAWVFADILRARGMLGSKNRIDWHDAEAVEIEWLQAWSSRKLPTGSSALEDAFAVAKENPLQLEGNRYLILAVNMGFALQRQNDPFPFILPVNSKVARTMGTTVPTVGSAVAKAIRDGYFLVEEATYSASTKRARLLRFNFDHPQFANNPMVQSHRSKDASAS